MNSTANIIAESTFRRATNGRAVTITSTHGSEKAATRRARKVGARVVIACEENAINEACWMVVDPSEDVSAVVPPVDHEALLAMGANTRARAARAHIANCRAINCAECRA